MRRDGAAMKDLIDKLKNTRVLVLGDAMIDDYVFGHCERLCPEGPIPVFVADNQEERHGGAWHVEDQLKALGCTGMAAFGSPMSYKCRFMVGHQLMFRVDSDEICSLDVDEIIKALNQYIFGEHKIDAIVLSDYAKGFLKPELCQYVIKFANDNGIPVIVDPKGPHWDKYAGALVICPNEREMIEKHHDSIYATFMLHKRGSKGLRLIYPDREQKDFPSVARHVYDVTGAGDTVVAVVAAVLAAKGTLEQAAQLANIAAGWCVGEVGTVCITAEKLKELV